MTAAGVTPLDNTILAGDVPLCSAMRQPASSRTQTPNIPMAPGSCSPASPVCENGTSSDSVAVPKDVFCHLPTTSLT